jgi:hypothetical protein
VSTLASHASSTLVDPLLKGLAARQNELAQLWLLQAQRQLYTDAKRLLRLQLALSVVLPVAAAITTLLIPDPTLKGGIALASIILTVVDVSLLDRHQRRTIENAAKVQEAFDCAVLDLPWDSFVVGSPAEPEIILDARTRYERKRGLKGLRNWYPVEPGDVPVHLGRLICQRGVLVYDSGLRRPYAIAALSFAAAAFFGLVFVAVLGDVTLEGLALSVFAPVAPLVTWAVREFFRHSEAADANDKLRSKVEKICEDAIRGEHTVEVCTAHARQIQTEMYRLRKSKPPVFEAVYQLLRSRLERRMRGVAREKVRAVEERHLTSPAVAATEGPVAPEDPRYHE